MVTGSASAVPGSDHAASSRAARATPFGGTASGPGGLTEADAGARLDQVGFNEIPEPAPRLWRSFFKRLWGPIPWMLEAALVLEAALGKFAEPAMIAAWLLFSAVVGTVQERRALRVLDLLRSRLRVQARVLRDGRWRDIAARELVPGDQIRVRPGDLVPADAQVSSGTVDVDESALTGESTPASRAAGETVHSASTVRRGEAMAVVTNTGARSLYGRTAELVRSARSAGHLDQLLFAVVRHLVTIDAVLAVVLLAFALWSGAPLLELVPFLLVLLIATVPVTMPAAFTVANAVEARALARQGVLVTGLAAVQEAATMDVLCVDKTGTLTQNRQVLVAVASLSFDSEDEVLVWAAAACDSASPTPLDTAILDALQRRDVPPLQRQAFVAFDPAARRSEATVWRHGASLRVVMGSPPAVQALVQSPPDSAAMDADALMARVETLAASGARVLAVAAGPDQSLRLRGLVALADTPRPEAAATVQALQDLGVRVMMVSGDTQGTARAVARQVGLGDRFGDAVAAGADPLAHDGFAGCDPQAKYRLVRGLQQAGRIVGMTGDGINDAPALRQAEVGIAVASATDVAKAAAQVVLTRPGLQDMVAIVHSGRRVYRRMLTWTLTKIARTVELAALLAFGYIATGFFVTSLLLIAVLVVLNDVVTITLATDRAWIAPAPEHWNVGEIGRVAGLFALAWLVLAFAILWLARQTMQLSVPQVQTLMFAYLIYSAQATIYLTRVRGPFWSFAPSRYVALATLGNVAIATAMGLLGILAAPVPAPVLLGTLLAVLAATFLLDAAKCRLFAASV